MKNLVLIFHAFAWTLKSGAHVRMCAKMSFCRWIWLLIEVWHLSCRWWEGEGHTALCGLITLKWLLWKRAQISFCNFFYLSSFQTDFDLTYKHPTSDYKIKLLDALKPEEIKHGDEFLCNLVNPENSFRKLKQAVNFLSGWCLRIFHRWGPHQYHA